MSIKESNRVCYIESRPEWFSYAVLRLFYRNPSWIFVPLQDLSEQDREADYQKAQYFFISGYGHSHQAKQAFLQGCVLIGPRADIPVDIQVLESKPWDPFGTFALIRFYPFINSVPTVLKLPTRTGIVWATKLAWLAYFAFRTLTKEGWQELLVKIRKFVSDES